MEDKLTKEQIRKAFSSVSFSNTMDFKMPDGTILRVTKHVGAVVPMTAKLVPLDDDKTPEQNALLQQMLKSYPVLIGLCNKATALHLVDLETGEKLRINNAPAYDKTKYKLDPEFCWQQKYDSPKQARGEIGLKQQAETCIPARHLETALQMLRLCRRPCGHPEDEEIIWHLNAVGEITNERCTDAACYERNDSPKHFVEVVEYHHKRQYDVPPETTKPGWYSLSRKNVCWVCGAECDGMMSLTESLKHGAGGPHPERLLTDGWHTRERNGQP